MERFLAGIAAGCVVGGAVAWFLAGGAAHGDVEPTGYTLDDIYQFIVSNGGTNPVEGAHSLYPSGVPGQGGMRTLKDIMAALRERLPCHGGGGGTLPATGQKTCYDGQGWGTECSSADWPGQDGYYQAGCPMEGRFVDNGDGTVSDLCTGLMWEKNTAPGSYTWQQALSYCEGLTLAGYTDWRLPNIRELQSIVDYGRSGPSIGPPFTAFSSWYWSSSTSVNSPDGAWIVDFGHGVVNRYDKKARTGYVRAVRSGP
ncbi:MAG: Lcl C-terminal domain-containing protein [Planctomycetota bacterium]